MWQPNLGMAGAQFPLPSGAVVVVHHYVGAGPALFVTCHALRINTMPLIATDVEVAKLEALHAVAEALDVLANDRVIVERWLGGSP